MVKVWIVLAVGAFSFGLYCCLVQGKKEDEILEELYRQMWGENDGRDGK